MKNYLIKKIKQRSTLDGAVLIIASAVYLIAEPIAALFAYAALVYGAFIVATDD